MVGKLFQGVVVGLFLFTSQVSFAAAEFPGCECPKVECDPCFEEQGMKFYSEKCGENGARVRSCAKPSCGLIDPLPSSCEQAKKQEDEKRTPASQVAEAPAEASPIVLAKAAAPVSLPVASRQELRGALVGEVKVLNGKVWIKPPHTAQELLKLSSKIYERDILTTEAKALVKVKFFDGNEITLTENTSLSVDQYGNNMSDKKRALLNLLKGRVRSQVNQKYDGKVSTYRVKTPTALAGVRGTDFVVSYAAADDKLITDVSTIEGKVTFGGKGAADSELVSVGEGEQVSFIVAANSSDVFTEDEMQAFVAKGYMTPVYKMTAPEISKLEAETGGRNRATASDNEAKNDSPACSAPAAVFNQCQWNCVNNPKGSDRCRTDLPQVNCVRKRCDANGNWSDESRLPASFHESCDAKAARVGPCDY